MPDGSFEESCGASEGPDSSFKGQQKQFVGPREVPWQSCWEGFKAFKGCWKRARWQFRSPIESCGALEVPDSSFEGQQKQFLGPREVPWQSCWEGFKAFKGCWKRARWQFRSPIETGCSASEMPDSSFEAQQKQHMAPREVSWQSCWEGFKAFRVFKKCWKRARWQFRSPIESCGASEGPDSSFEAQQKQFVGPREVPWQSCWEGFKAFKGCWKRARWQFRSPIETGCGAAEVSEIAASKPNRNSSWGLGKSRDGFAGFKAFKGC